MVSCGKMWENVIPLKNNLNLILKKKLVWFESSSCLVVAPKLSRVSHSR